MLQYNFSRIFRLREIEKPVTFLRKHRFSDNLAHRIAKDKVKKLSLEQLETICTLLCCTPHDVMEWVPEKEDESTAKHPLAVLRKEVKEESDILDHLRKMPLEQLNEIRTIIAQQTQNNTK